jgi:hypothetical protein
LQSSNAPTLKAYAIVLTSAALVGVNMGLALLIVAAIGMPSFAPTWFGGAVLVLGLLAAAAAFMLWRSYLQAVHEH